MDNNKDNDMNFRYSVCKNGISAHLSSPSAGFLGLQINGDHPTQMTARVYGRYPFCPDDDVDILVLRCSPKDNEQMTVQVAYKMDAPKAMLTWFKAKLPAVMASSAVQWREAIAAGIGGVQDAAINYDVQLSQLSVLFRNFIVEFQKNVQNFLDAAVKILRETQFRLPGSDEMTTLPIVLKDLTRSAANDLCNIFQIIYSTLESYCSAFVDNFSTVEPGMPAGVVRTIGQIINNMKVIIKSIFEWVIDFVNSFESLDTILVKTGEILKAVVDKVQEFFDFIKSHAVLCRHVVTLVKKIAHRLSGLSKEQLNGFFESLFDLCIYFVDQFSAKVIDALQELPEDPQRKVKISDGTLEFELTAPVPK